jgi:hypothetical protein
MWVFAAGRRSSVSFQALIERAEGGAAVTGNPGLAPAIGPPPAWAGFRPLRVSRKNRSPYYGGTAGSIPTSSSGESAANLTSSIKAVEPAGIL